MADRLDVAQRIAEGRPAVEHTQSYVRACQVLGYQHPDLTAYPGQVRDWYDSEDGLDLHVLDSDCAELRAAAAAVTEALRMQRAQIAALNAAWTGSGADSAIWFLQRHCDAANMVATEVRAAAQRCESLRDNLWQLLDAKVATAVDIDDRTLAQRPSWLAAVDAVTTGATDRQTVDEVVHRQIKPYVDTDIRIEWLTAMRSTQAGVAASYEMVTDRFAAAPAASFEIPGDFGPGAQPLGPAQPNPPTAPAAVVAPVGTYSPYPTSQHDPGPPAMPMPPPQNLSQAPPASDLADWGTSLGDGSAMAPGSGGGLTGLGGLGGLSGLANRIVDAVGGLLGSPADGLTDPSTSDDPLDSEDPFDKADADQPDEVDEADERDVTHAAEAKTPPAEGTPPADQPPAGEPLAAAQPPPAAQPVPAGQSPPAAHPPPAAPPGPPPRPSGASTPCEIAADELPQAGQ